MNLELSHDHVQREEMTGSVRSGGIGIAGFPRQIASDERRLPMIEKLKSGGYRLYSRKKDPKTRKRRNLGTFKSREAAEKHEREVQYFKRH